MRFMTDMSRVPRQTALAVTVIAVAVALAACGAKKPGPTQAAARVDGAEITVHQINYRLQRERGLRADQMEQAGRKVLDQLIDEQLVVEKAEKEKLDKDPQAAQAMDAARREVLARAYVEQVAQGVPAPTEDALHRYYEQNDALFTRRRIYTLQEFLAQVPVDRIPVLKAMIDAGKPVADVAAWFKEQNVPFRGQQGVHPAEQVPLNSLKQLADVPDGRGLITSTGDQVHVTYVVSSVSEPVDYDKAKPAITQFLGAESRRKTTEGNLAALRSAAKIQYMAPYEGLAASQAAAFSLKDVAATAPAPQASGDRVSLPVSRASGVQVTLPTAEAGVHVELPTSTSQGVRVSLPSTAASSVEVRLPPQSGVDSGKK
jgi:EpsD family peptidyl-prolyl cis-trans isomerase